VVYQLKKMSLKRMQHLMQERGVDFYPDVIAALEGDPRGGAQRLVRLCRERLAEWEHEKAAVARLYVHEQEARTAGATLVAGVSEVGRGPVAGPVVAAAVILPPGLFLPGLSDVRRLTARRRQELATLIRQEAIALQTSLIQPDGADEGSVIRAIYRAMTDTVRSLALTPDHLLVDGLHVPQVRQPQTLVVEGEEASASIAAAQVIARAVRDEYMQEMDAIYPGYGFAAHKGYGTATHRDALRRFGPSPIHRGPIETSQMVAASGQSEDQN
jgi:ribonuclease HII